MTIWLRNGNDKWSTCQIFLAEQLKITSVRIPSLESLRVT
jgi:hypothetical protein